MNVYATNKPAEGYEFMGSFNGSDDPLLACHVAGYALVWNDEENTERPEWTRFAAESN